MADYTAQIEAIYLAYYGRPADVTGLAYWNTALNTANGDLASIINSFGTSAEATSLYSSSSNIAKINAIYVALFNRTADAEGLIYYAGLLDTGAKSQASIALDILNGATGDDLTLITKKLVVSADFTAAMQSDATAMIAYAGTTAATTARAMLSAVTADSDDSGVVETTLTTIETDATDTTTAAAQTFTLTTSDAGDATGDTGDDKFIALDDALTQYVVDGADGEDALIATISETDTYEVSNVETITFKVTAAATIDMDDFSGEKSVTLKGAGDTTLENFDASVALTSERTGANDLTVTLDDASGSADSLALTLDDATATGEYVFANIETIELTSSGSENVINLDADSATTLDISGDADIDVTIVATTASLETIDASAATGDVTIDASAVALTLDVTTGSGDDTLEMGAELDAADVIDMGAGEDTLSVDASTSIIDAETDITNVETLSITSVTTTDALDASIVSFDNIVYTSTADADVFTITGVTTESITITSDDAEFDLAEVDISLDDATGDSDTATLIIENSAEDGADFEVTLIDSTGGNIETLALDFVQGGDVEGSDITVAEIATSDFATLEISGDADATVGATATGVEIETIDASAATGDLTIVLGNADQSITGGAGDDTFTFSTADDDLTTADTIVGGSGEDTITAQLVASATAAATISGVETIELDFDNASSVFSGKNATGIATLVLTGDNAISITNLDAEATTIEISDDVEADVTIAYAAESDSDHTLLLSAAAASNLEDITITKNAGGLTIETDTAEGDFTVTSITAALATSLTVTTTDGDLVIDGAEGIEMVSATSIEITTDGGAFDVSGASTNSFTDATSITLNALDGDILFDGAGSIVSDADVVFTATADGEGNLIDITALDVEFGTDITLTATDGGSVVLDNLIFAATNSDGEDIDVTLTLSATDADSTVTVTDITVGAGVTLDSVILESSAEGVVSFTASDTTLTITTIDASAAEADGVVINVSSLDAATEITLGAGSATVTTSDNGDTVIAGSGDLTLTVTDGTADITLGEGSDTLTFLLADASTVADFDVENDVIVLDNSVLEAIDGTNLVDGNSDNVSALTAVAIDDAVSGAAYTMDTSSSVLRLTGNIGSAALLDAELVAFLDDSSFADNDDIVVLWYDGSDTHVSLVALDTIAAGDITAVTVNDMVVLTGIDIADLTAANFGNSFIA